MLIWPWLKVKTVLGSHFGVGEFTHFRTYFSGDWDVHGILTHGHMGVAFFRGPQKLCGCPFGFAFKSHYKGYPQKRVFTSNCFLWVDVFFKGQETPPCLVVVVVSTSRSRCRDG